MVGPPSEASYEYCSQSRITRVRELIGVVLPRYRRCYPLCRRRTPNLTTSYSYSSGRMASKTDAKGQQLTYQYDSYGRLTSVTWANAPGGSKVLRTYSFDTNPVDATFSHNALGRLTAVQYATLAGQVRMIDMYSYVAAGTNGGGKIATKRLQVNEDVTWVDSLGGGHSASPKANLDIGYTYDNEGRTTAMSYPATGGTGIGYNYSYDSLKRLSGMTDFSSATVVSSVSYGPANELLGMNYSGYSESRTYNSLLQLTDLSVSGATTHYVFPSAGSNAGKISSQKIGASGEEVLYTYDSLNRLITASTSSTSDANGNTAWGQSFGYDAFGSLTAKTATKGSPPVLSVAVDPATNRIVGSSYDANGNITGGYVWDAENRLTSVPSSATAYGYDAQNKRFFIWDGTTVDGYGGNTNGYTVNVYTPGGQKLGAYQINVTYTGSTYAMGVTLLKSDAYFGGRRVQKEDRLSSVGTYYPYGEEKGSSNPANDNWKFGTYWRDSLTALDYADQRYYSNGSGKFLTPDPSMQNVDYNDPISWNAYSYTNGDPINFNDPTGLVACGDLINQSNGRSVRTIMTTYNDLGYLAQTVWHEGGPVYASDIADPNSFITQQAYLATALENRFDIANGTLTAYTKSGGTVDPNAFGGPGATLTDVILQAAGNNQSWGIYTNGAFDDMNALLKVLNTDVSVGTQVPLSSGNSVNTECFAALSAVTQALEAQSGVRTQPDGVILAYWNLATNSSPAGNQTITVPKIRIKGDTFYGYSATPQPPPVRRPPPRRRPL
jgi:RHS repeat-associated protein